MNAMPGARESRARSRFTPLERSWIIYDWANSVYATIMMAAVFSAFFTGLVDDPRGGDYWWSIGTTISVLAVAVMAPIAGAFADYKGYKKKLFGGFLAIGLVFTGLCAVSDNWRFLLVGYIFSHIGFSGSCLLYDSFLPDVTTPDRMDRVSGWGYAMGYIGGSTIPFLISIALIQFGGSFGLTTTTAVKLSVLLTVAWWGVFSIPFLRNVKQVGFVEKPKDGVLRETLSSIAGTAKKIVSNKGLLLFLAAYFFYIDGVGTIISLATSYGTQLGLGMIGMILALLVTQIVAFPFSILFSRFAKRVGSLNMLTIAVVIYAAICVVGFFMGYLIERAEIPVKLEALAEHGAAIARTGNLTVINQALMDASIPEAAWNARPEYVSAVASSTVLFWILAAMVGSVQGGIQALSRSYFGKLAPQDHAGEYFGFFEIFGKFAAIVGPLLYAMTKAFTGRSSYSILSIALLFCVSLVIMAASRKYQSATQTSLE
ncbi:MAG: MFS transporter [Oscillospiraceae bacterium]|jgi:UMF1 family MFS transporter|nr:MFS transporter [Oscillospiraceae bacterium]